MGACFNRLATFFNGLVAAGNRWLGWPNCCELQGMPCRDASVSGSKFIIWLVSKSSRLRFLWCQLINALHVGESQVAVTVYDCEGFHANLSAILQLIDVMQFCTVGSSGVLVLKPTNRKSIASLKGGCLAVAIAGIEPHPGHPWPFPKS